MCVFAPSAAIELSVPAYDAQAQAASAVHAELNLSHDSAFLTFEATSASSQISSVHPLKFGSLGVKHRHCCTASQYTDVHHATHRARLRSIFDPSRVRNLIVPYFHEDALTFKKFGHGGYSAKADRHAHGLTLRIVIRPAAYFNMSKVIGEDAYRR